MKKFVLLALLVIAPFASAQDAFKADAMKVIKASGAASTIDVAKKQILEMVPEAKRAAFLVEFEASLPSLYEKLAEIYMKEYTHDDIKQMLAFYETPVGKKIAGKAGAVYEQSTAAGQEWGMSLQSILMKYMQ
jgi:hypothetical protein